MNDKLTLQTLLRQEANQHCPAVQQIPNWADHFPDGCKDHPAVESNRSSSEKAGSGTFSLLVTFSHFFSLFPTFLLFTIFAESSIFQKTPTQFSKNPNPIFQKNPNPIFQKKPKSKKPKPNFSKKAQIKKTQTKSPTFQIRIFEKFGFFQKNLCDK